MPYENEHACRLRDPDEFVDDSFFRQERETDEGKEYEAVVGELEDSGETADQSYRYPVDEWSEAEAREHCSEHDGKEFHPAEDNEDDETATGVTVHLREDVDQSCASQHFGPWLIAPDWFRQAVRAVQDGTWERQEIRTAHGKRGRGSYEVTDGIAVIDIEGQMQKKQSSFGGTSSIAARLSIRKAVEDEDVQGIILRIDSPGGTASGTADLGDEVARAAEEKPVHAYIEDLGASAAYWVASQSDEIAANRTAHVGSIGTVSVVHDMSELAEQQGVKVHVISTGEYKGLGIPGSEVTDEHLEYLQERVEELNEHFLEAVENGRGLNRAAVEASADGRVFIASDAQERGLIDRIESFDTAFKRLQRVVDPKSNLKEAETMAEEESQDEVQEEVVEDAEQSEEVVEAEEAEETTEAVEDTKEDARAELGDFMDEFGAEQGAKWYREGLSLAEAKDRHRDLLQQELKEKQERIEQAELGADEEETPEFSPAEGDSIEEVEEYTRMGLSDNLAAFAASIEFANE